MSAPPVMPPRLRRQLAAARLILRIERWWPACVAAASSLCVFTAFALFAPVLQLPGRVHAVLLVLWAAASIWSVLRMRPRGPSPGPDDAARLLEQTNRLPHRPIRSYFDVPAPGGDMRLWQAEQTRIRRDLNDLRLPFPRSDMAARDPWGLRAAALLMLAAALAGGTDGGAARMAAALHPALDVPGLLPERVEFWASPPDHTGRPAFALTEDGMAVPAGSTIRVSAAGGILPLTLHLGGARADMRPAGSGRAAELPLTETADITVSFWGITAARRNAAAIADASPSAEFVEPPVPAERGRLHAAVAASDDYGLARLWLRIRRVGETKGETPLDIELPLPPGRPKQSNGSGWHDLTAHPWAGLPVVMQPMATDSAGQTGAGETAVLTLPERRFADPAAALVIEQRRLITESPDHRFEAAEILDEMSADDQAIQEDWPAFLALRLAVHMLVRGGYDLAELQDLLWNAALRLEDGDLAGAEQALEQARRALEQAAQDENVSPAQLQRLLDAFQDALERWMDSMTARMDEALPPEAFEVESDNAVSDQDLLDMIQTMRDLAAAGSRDAVRQMLRDMTELLTSLQNAPPAKQSAEAAQGLRQLRDLAERQQNLLDRNRSMGRNNRPPAPAHEEAAEQNALRENLNAAMRLLEQGLGQAPSAAGDAEQAMQWAEEALSRGDRAGAEHAQAQALYGLQQAARQVLENMAAGGMGAGIPRDPLGRPLGRGIGDDGETRIPGQAELNKAREILDELRRRAGEFTRPEDEREYLQRLLRRF